jgi:lipoprotein-releasing system permease protein
MGYPFDVALRYLGSKKRAFISVGTAFAILGVCLGVAALATVMSVTGGFQAQFREKVLGVNAHVLVLKYSTDFREYRSIMEQVAKVPGVVGVAPFSINPMMLTHGEATATGVLLKGVDPAASLGVDAAPGVIPVLDLPTHIQKGDLRGLRLPGAKPPDRPPTTPQTGALPPPIELGDAGVGEVERDDAGRPIRLLEAIQREPWKDAPDAGALPEDDPNKDPPEPKQAVDEPAGDDEAEQVAKADDPLDAGVRRTGPVGSVEPDGGYASVLPDTDELPADVDPDLCADPELVSKMPGIVIGISLAKTLKLDIGNCLTVTSPTIGFSFSGGQIKPPVAKRFRVIAIFEAGFDQYDSKLVYTDLYEAQAFYDQGDTVTGVEMKVDDIDDAGAISDRIAQMLATGLYHTMDWEELNHGLFTALRIQQIGMSAVLALIIVVAAFTVIATLIMVVLDKKKEIAVIKAMGATDDAILRIFLYQGGIIGVAGTTLGLLLGYAVCEGLIVYGFPLDPKVYFISRLPVQARPQEFLITGAIAILICLCATIVPALYAARLRPAEGFRDQ